MNLIDMFLKGQGGQNIDALARQFNLSQQQTVAALEALMPAFSQGLQRNAADPMGFGAFVQALSAGQNVNYFDNPQAAFNPSGIADGNYVLGQLFGSKDLSRAIADHAASAAGVGADTLKQMLPVVASMMMGGLYKKSTGQFAAAGLGGGNVIGDLIEQMMRQGGGQAIRLPTRRCTRCQSLGPDPRRNVWRRDCGTAARPNKSTRRQSTWQDLRGNDARWYSRRRYTASANAPQQSSAGRSTSRHRTRTKSFR